MQNETVTFTDSISTPLWRTSGKKQDIIILHGWSSSFYDWEPFIESLQNDFNVYIWHARAYNDNHATIAKLASDTAFIIEKYNLKQPALIGHSMGALTILEYISQFGTKDISAICLIDQSPKIITDTDWSLGLYRNYTTEDNYHFITDLQKDFVPAVMKLILANKIMTEYEREAFKKMSIYLDRERQVAGLKPESWIHCWSDFVQKDYREVLKKIDIPTQLIYGGKSNFYGFDVANYIHSQIKGSKLEIFAEAGHSPQIEDMPRFLDIIRNFIAQT